MRINYAKIHGFKNLNSFSIELDKTKMHSILIGQNAAGKSNFLEALVIIFRDLDLNDKTYPEFDFDLSYDIENSHVRIIGNKSNQIEKGIDYFIERQKTGYTFFINEERTTKASFYKANPKLLPKHVFSYYSGISNRLEEHFDLHQRRFLKDLLDGQDDPMRPLFYARHIHSHFVLMAFYGFPEKKIKEFLKNYLNILGLESILFVLKNPYWYKGKPIDDGDDKFWYARGVVKDFLNDLWNASIGPIPFNEKVREDFHKNPDQEHLYLYISSEEKLVALAKKYGTNANFFKMLESTYISDLIQEVRIKVRKENVNGHITFKELSEGEQQLLTVLGLMRFTKESDTLFLLDEPDTHLNPLWKWRYIELMEGVVDRDSTSQVIMTTHDPLVIGSLEKEEVRIFKTDDKMKIFAQEPEFDPKGLGVEGVLTSEFFNLPTSLAPDIANKMDRQIELFAKKNKTGLTKKEEVDLAKINDYLDAVSINQKSIDPLYDQFLTAVSQIDEFQLKPANADERKKQEKRVLEVLREIKSKTK